MDDNIDGFHYLTRNVKWKMRTGAGLAIAEEFFTRFSNIAIGSLNYSKFVKECDCVPPFIINTRMYSCLFIKNDIPFEWRGRYNEDTILSLDVLTGGKYCTCQLNAFLADKLTTTRVKGGNTDMFYDKEEHIINLKCLLMSTLNMLRWYINLVGFIIMWTILHLSSPLFHQCLYLIWQVIRKVWRL